MRAVIAIAAFAVAAQAAALPAGEIIERDGGVLGLPATPDTAPTSGGLNPANNPNAGGSTPPTTGGSTPPTTGGSTPPTTGGSTPPTTGGSPPPAAGGSTPPTTGGSPPPAAGGSTPPTTGGSTPPTTGGSSPAAGGSSPANGGSPPPAGSTTYTPYYPSGGYKQPPSYPSGSDYSPSKPYNPSSYTGDYGDASHPYNPSYPAAGNYGQPQNYGSDYQPSGYSKPAGCEVSYPAKGDHVTCGSATTFKWSGFTGKKVQIELVYGTGETDCHHYTTINDDCDNSGSYTWTPPTNLPPTGGNYGYGIKVTCKDTGKVIYSPQFCFDNHNFYNDFKHPACPTVAPTPITIPCATSSAAPVPVSTPCTTAAPSPVSTPCETATAAPVPVTTPCPTPVPAVAPNATAPQAPQFTGAASGLKASMTFVAGLAVLVAFAL